jgi:hypothetical protein
VDDYAGIPIPLTRTWSGGNTTPKTITLPIFADALLEGDENFTATVVGSDVGTPSTVTIADNPPGTIQFGQATYATTETSGTVTLDLDRVGGSVGELTVQIQTFDGTATIIDDYAGIPTPLTLTWSDGNTTPKTVTLPIKIDALLEATEDFTMAITSTNPTGSARPAPPPSPSRAISARSR